MIIFGYFQIGKTTLAEKNKNYIDLDHYQFFIKGKRDANNWHIPYCQLAEYLSKQGHKVLVCMHSDVVEYFSKSSEKVIAVLPHPVLIKEGKWIDKEKNGWRIHGETDEDFIDRITSSKKNLDAAAEFACDISTMIKDTRYITSMDYNLEDFIKVE